MVYCGIICEYNPLHSGHIFHLESTKQALKPDGIICVMSGNFVQRGEPAVADKYTRAAWAVRAGADMVIELPAVFALSPAENFAYGGVRLLSCVKNVKYLSFGSESGDIDKIRDLIEELGRAGIKQYLNSGISYASSFAAAGSGNYSSNNILAAEYLRAIDKLCSNITPFTVKRKGNYNGADCNGTYCSAAAVREQLYSGGICNVKKYLPDYVYNSLSAYTSPYSALFDMLVYRILSSGKSNLSDCAYISEGLHNRIFKGALKSLNYEELLDNISTKRYPDAKIRRILMCLLLNITAENVAKAKKTPPQARVLALKKGREDILSEISKDINLITRASDYGTINNLAETDILASMIYSKITGRKVNDYCAGLPKIVI